MLWRSIKEDNSWNFGSQWLSILLHNKQLTKLCVYFGFNRLNQLMYGWSRFDLVEYLYYLKSKKNLMLGTTIMQMKMNDDSIHIGWDDIFFFCYQLRYYLVDWYCHSLRVYLWYIQVCITFLDILVTYQLRLCSPSGNTVCMNMTFLWISWCHPAGNCINVG